MPILTQEDGSIFRITIDGYNDYNPMNQEMYLELVEAFKHFEATRGLHVAVVTGAGDKNFSAGGNLRRANNMDAFFEKEAVLENFWEEQERDPQAWIDGYITLCQMEVRKPVIAAVRGYCLGAALMMLGSRTDIRIAGESAEFGFTEIRWGLGACAAILSRLTEQIPHVAVMWLIAGQHIKAQDALRYCLVNEVVPDDQVVARAEEIAQSIAKLPMLPIRAEKQAYLRTRHMSHSDALLYGLSLFPFIQMSEDAKEGVRAWVDKREPNFLGR